MKKHLVDSDQIVRLRKQKSMKQDDLATEAKVPNSVISRMERKLQYDYSLKTVHSVARALGVTIDDLLLSEEKLSVGELSPELKIQIYKLDELNAGSQRLIAAIIRAFVDNIDDVD